MKNKPFTSKILSVLNHNLWFINYQIKTSYSSKIADASSIGLECESGNVEDCNDGTDLNLPKQCKGVLILPETETKCGSQCARSSKQNQSRSSENHRKWWTYWTRPVNTNFYTTWIIYFKVWKAHDF